MQMGAVVSLGFPDAYNNTPMETEEFQNTFIDESRGYHGDDNDTFYLLNTASVRVLEWSWEHLNRALLKAHAFTGDGTRVEDYFGNMEILKDFVLQETKADPLTSGVIQGGKSAWEHLKDVYYHRPSTR